MSILTLDEIKTEIRSGMGNRTDTDSRLNGVINLSQTRIARLRDFDELRALAQINTPFTGTIADKFLTLASLNRYRKIYSIRLYASGNQSRKLIRVLPKRWDKIIPEPEFYARGKPLHYVIWSKDNLEMHPLPDAVYVLHVRYSRWPNLVTGATGGATFLDLEDLDDLIVHLSLSYLFLSLNNLSQSDKHYGIYRTLVAEHLNMEEEDFDTFQTSPDQMSLRGPGRGYDDPFVNSIGSTSVFDE